jgi:hypothetical protein
MGEKGGATENTMESDSFDPEEEAFQEVTQTRVVKLALASSLALTEVQSKAFRLHVDKLVSIVSRCLRRGSLIFAFNMTRLLETNQPIPDLFNQKDTFWKHALLAEPPPGFPHLGDITFAASQDDDIIRVAQRPPGFDQVLAYAAITYRTCVINTTCVPLFARLGRYTKGCVHLWTQEFGKAVTPSVGQILAAIRAPLEDSVAERSSWPPPVGEYVAEIRARLKAEPATRLHDDSSKTMMFETLLKFNYWMQQGFRMQKARLMRLMRLMPIMRVHRAHIRLDCKSLLAIFSRVLAPPPSLPPKLLKRGVTADKWVAYQKELARCREEQAKAKAAKAVAKLQALPAKVARDQALAAAAEDRQHGHEDPKRSMLAHIVRPTTKRKATVSSEEWAAYRKAMKEFQEETARVQATLAYKEQQRRYEAFVETEMQAVRSGFKRMRQGKPFEGRRSWEFDCSIVTDGLSVSLQYSRKVMRKVGGSKEKKAVQRKRAAVASQAPAAVDYDRDLTTFMEDEKVCVLGLDPGRVNLATVTYLRRSEGAELSEESQVWKLRRSDYRGRSGINRQDAEQQRRYAPIEAALTGLSQDEACLAGLHSSEMLAYMEQYSEVEDRWWELALQRRESRAQLQRYIGKRKVLDGFFGGMQRTMRSRYPGVDIQVAYGSSGPTMKASGRGEQAVPTTGTYKACLRVFGKGGTHLTDEFRTTVVDWESGSRGHAVFMKPEADGTYGLGHVEPNVQGRQTHLPPMIEKEDVECVTRWRKERMPTWRSKREGTMPEENGRKELNSRYPMIRGLRFCPENSKYHDRDRTAALTIARLHCLSVLGRPRPQPFSRAFTVA